NNDVFKAGNNIKSYDFFSYENLEEKSNPTPSLPVIPGSEIRGMIRNAFEALTNSCMSTIDDKQLLYKRTTQPGKPGMLVKENNQWKIKKCKKYMLKVYACDKDPNFISSVDITTKLWNILSSLKFSENDRKKSYFYNPRNEYKLAPEFKKINKKISITIDGKKLHYHTKMTEQEKEQLLNLSSDKNYIEAIETLYKKSQKYHSKEEVKEKEKEKIWFKVDGKYNGKHYMPETLSELSFNQQYGKDWETGFIHIAEDIERKHHDSIFVLTNEVEVISDNKAIKNFLESIKLYQDKSINIHFRKEEHSGYKYLKINNFDNTDLLNGFLIYYTKHNSNYYISPAAIGREVFHNKLSTYNIIKNYNPCAKLDNLCSACVLFGISGENKESASSRLRFTDAFIVNDKKLEDYYENPVILPELASPKLSATEFYLKKPEGGADLWNYDYAIENKQEISYTPSIRGRKFYWHKKITSTPSEKNKVSERNIKIRPLKKGNEFTFKVYFNDITENELKKLLWVINIGTKKENAHKIGMGKPVGMGSVKISVNDVKVRNITLNEKRIEHKLVSDKIYLKQPDLKKEIINLLGCSSKVLEDFLKITDFEYAPNNVSYPKNTDSEESYNWFVANKTCKGTGVSHIIAQILPDIQTPELKKYKEKEEDRNKNYNKRR
ncbi:MAG: TIGR03986 family CRISPR-associated RAMP protein, partial [Candidatus Eremiobacterota bacterium]